MSINLGPPHLLKYVPTLACVEERESFQYAIFRPIPSLEEGIGRLVHALLTSPCFSSPEKIGIHIGQYPDLYRGLHTITHERIPSPGKFAEILDPTNPLDPNNPSVNRIHEVNFSVLMPHELEQVEAAIRSEKKWASLDFLRR